MMPVSPWVLGLVFWLHMIATVVWIGGLAALAIIVLPAARHVLQAQPYAEFLTDLQRRLDPIAWFCLITLAGTGMIQMSANPHYQGVLVIQNGWAVAIFLKHMVFLGMACLSVYLTWGLMPKLQRNALKQVRGTWSGELVGTVSQSAASETAKLQRQETLLMRLNLILGIIVLGLTALARAA